MMRIPYHLTVLLISLIYSYDASAQVDFTNNEAQFNDEHPGLVTQDFSVSDFSPGETECCEVPVDENSDDLCFSPGQILPGIQFQNGPVPADFGICLAGPDSLGNNNPIDVLIAESFSLDFETVFPGDNVRAVGLRAGCLFDFGGPCSTVIEVRVFGPGNADLGATDLGVTDQFDSFIGIESTVSIKRIRLSNLGDPSLKGVGEVRFEGAGRGRENIPTLSELGMIAAAAGLGMIGVLYAVRKRRVQAGS